MSYLEPSKTLKPARYSARRHRERGSPRGRRELQGRKAGAPRCRPCHQRAMHRRRRPAVRRRRPRRGRSHLPDAPAAAQRGARHAGFDVYGIRRMWRVWGTVAPREHVSLPVGEFDAWHLAGQAARLDIPQARREVHVWISDDVRRAASWRRSAPSNIGTISRDAQRLLALRTRRRPSPRTKPTSSGEGQAPPIAASMAMRMSSGRAPFKMAWRAPRSMA